MSESCIGRSCSCRDVREVGSPRGFRPMRRDDSGAEPCPSTISRSRQRPCASCFPTLSGSTPLNHRCPPARSSSLAAAAIRASTPPSRRDRPCRPVTAANQISRSSSPRLALTLSGSKPLTTLSAPGHLLRASPPFASSLAKDPACARTRDALTITLSPSISAIAVHLPRTLSSSPISPASVRTFSLRRHG